MSITIEDHKRFSQSALWSMQRRFFDKQGINAWVNQIPFYVTCNPFIANCYAQLALAFMRDWTNNHPDAKNHPFYILELGTGSGRFSFYFVKKLTELIHSLKITNITFCYIMSDFTEHNITYWETHPALKPYIEKGILDFAQYNLEEESDIHLHHKHISLNQQTLKNPLIAFANYVFDSISHDMFGIKENALWEVALGLSTEEDNIENNLPVDVERILIDYQTNEINSDYYGEPALDAILETYKKSLHGTSILIPIGAIRAIEHLKKLSGNKLFLVSTDKGQCIPESLENYGHHQLVFHGGCFSLMVNYHALAQYFKHEGGDYFLQTPRPGIKTAIFSSHLPMQELPKTRIAITRYIEAFGLPDFMSFFARLQTSPKDYNLEDIGAHMQLSEWDPDTYQLLKERTLSLLEDTENTVDRETLFFMKKNMHKIAENYYFLPKSECVLFDIGLFFYTIKEYAQAIPYFEQTIPYESTLFSYAHYNLGLCHHFLNDQKQALSHFKNAAQSQEKPEETLEWISYVETLL